MVGSVLAFSIVLVPMLVPVCGRGLLAVEWVIMCSTEDNIELYMTAGRQRLRYLKKTAAVSHVRQWGLLVVRNHLNCRLNTPVKTVTESPEHLLTLMYPRRV